MKNEKVETLKNLAIRAHYNTSFSPEKRGEQIVAEYGTELNEDIETIKSHEGDVESYETKYISFLSDWLSAKSRCISSMITGPSNFPIRRAEKANRSEENKYNAFREWRKKALNRITRPENTDIVKGTEGAIDKMISKLGELEKNQNCMKGINKIIKDKKLTDAEKVERISSEYPTIKSPADLLSTARFGGPGFPSFSLTNNNARINSLKKNIEAEKRRTEKYSSGNKEYQINGVDICENVDENRLQILFDGKPDPEMISKLKQNGYRWSPRNMAWQRQLTNNAIYSLKFIFN